MKRFNKEKDEILIDFVKHNRELYDPNHTNFKNSLSKHKCWEKISANIDIPVLECKKRWKSLRDQYNKKKKLESLGAVVTRYHTSWNFMPLMSFLAGEVSESDTISNVPNSCMEEILQLNVQEDMQEDTSEDTQEEIHQPETNTIKRRKRKRDVTVDCSIKHETQQPLLYTKLLEKSTSRQTPIKKFFDSMADIVDTFPPHLKAETRLKICQIVTEAELTLHSQQALNSDTRMPSNSWSSL